MNSNVLFSSKIKTYRSILKAFKNLRDLIEYRMSLDEPLPGCLNAFFGDTETSIATLNELNKCIHSLKKIIKIEESLNEN